MFIFTLFLFVTVVTLSSANNDGDDPNRFVIIVPNQRERREANSPNLFYYSRKIHDSFPSTFNSIQNEDLIRTRRQSDNNSRNQKSRRNSQQRPSRSKKFRKFYY